MYHGAVAPSLFGCGVLVVVTVVLLLVVLVVISQAPSLLLPTKLYVCIWVDLVEMVSSVLATDTDRDVVVPMVVVLVEEETTLVYGEEVVVVDTAVLPTEAKP